MSRIFICALVPYLLSTLLYDTPYSDIYLCVLALTFIINLIRRKNLGIIALSLLFSILAFVNCSKAYSLRSKSFYPLLDKPVTLRCVVCDTPSFTERGGNYTVKMLSAVYKDETYMLDGKTYVLCNGSSEDSNISYGDVLEFKTVLSLPDESTNEGEFSYRKYLNGRNIFVTCQTYDFSITNHGKYEKVHPFLYNVYSLRGKLLQKIDEYFRYDISAFVKALMLGYKADMSDEISEHISHSGISHVVSVSGLHLSILMVYVSFFIRKLKFRYSIFVIPILNILCALFITVLTGFSPSVLRAALMLIMSNAASLFYRENDSLQSLSFAVLIILLANPCAIYDVRLVLSALSVLGIILFQQKFKDFFIKYIKLQTLAEICAMTFAAQLVTFPAAIFYFGTVSAISFVTNIIVVPIIPALMGVGILFFICPYYWITQYLSGGIWLTVKFILKVAELLSSLPFATFEISVAVFTRVLYTCATVTLCVRKIIKSRSELKRFSYFIISCVAVFTMFFTYPQQSLSLTPIITTSGDCTLLQLPNGKTMLIDCGSYLNNQSSAYTVREYLFRKGINRIDYAIISSIDANKARNVLSLSKDIELGCVIAPDYLTPDNAWLLDEIYRKCSASDIPLFLMGKGDCFSPCGNVSFNILSPDTKISYNNNTCSLVFKVSYAKSSILFTGDISGSEKHLLTHGASDISADILKLPDGGAYTWADEDFINAVNPGLAYVFTDSLSGKTAELLSDSGVSVRSTGYDKLIKLTINKDGKLRIY